MTTINEKIFDRSVAHQTNVINFSRSNAATLAAKLNSDIDSLKKEILLFLDNNDTSNQRTFLLKTDLKKLNSLENKLRKIRKDQYSDIKQELLSLVFEFMSEEKKIQQDIIYGDWYDPIVQTDKEDNNYFLLMIFLGATFDQNYQNLVSADINRIIKTLRNGISQNQTNTQILNSIFGTKQNQNTDGVLNTSKNQLESLATSSIIAAQTAVISGLNDKNKKKLTMYGQFVAILDSRTSAICQSLSGKIDKYELLPHPPLHPNALRKGTLISTKNGKVKIEDIKLGDKVLTHDGSYRKVYAKQTENVKSGFKREVRVIKLPTGKTIFATPDHPFLTDKGWISCRNLTIGDNLVQGVDNIGVQNLNPAHIETKDIVTKFRDVDVARHILGFAVTSRPVTLDNKVTTGYKEVTYEATDHILVNELNISCFQSFKYKFLSNRDAISLTLRKRLQSFTSSFGVVLRVIGQHSIARCFEPSISFFSAASTPRSYSSRFLKFFKIFTSSFTLCLPAAKTIFNSVFSYGIIRQAIFSFKRSKRLFRHFMFLEKFKDSFFSNSKFHSCCVKIESIDIILDESQYYNLSVGKNETYIAEDIVTHNCRSHIAPYFKKVPEVSKTDLGNRPQETDYQQWLKRQPRSVQEQILGVKRTELLRSGKLTIDKFYSNNNDLYTLKELSRRYKDISSSIN